MRVPGFAAVALAIALAGPGAAARQDPQQTFEDFLADLRAEALSKGISQATVDEALGAVQLEPVVIARDRAQPELTRTLDEYVAQRLTTKTVTTAREKAATYRGVLSRVTAAYGVPPPVMVAIWGLESNFGSFTGTYPTVTALATLAYDGRRQLFRTELLEALRIIDRGVAHAADLKGSWAGAMGQPQFMPSSFLRYAVDFDGDGRVDIWTNPADVFGSMANYLQSAGWRLGERWGREVAISRAAMARIDRDIPMRTSGCRAVREMTVSRPLSDWRRLGVTLRGGAALPSASMSASLVRGARRHFLVYRNYEAILGYNCSHNYAISVGLLSDRIPR
jgi:membrane-bound lytic murein transglycosylase B